MNNPDCIILAQHGWSDDGHDIGNLARAMVTTEALVIAPSLGILKTYWRIEPLIKQLEQITLETIKNYPKISLRMIGHSMGGLICIELLHRHPELWHRVHSLVVIGSPIGGSHLARMIDPLGIGIGMARDLGRNRRETATRIAQQIPTLAIAGDLGFGTDGMVTVENTKFAHSQFICLRGAAHVGLKSNQKLIPIIQEFWRNPQIAKAPANNLATRIIQYLQQVPGMTDAHYRNFSRSQIQLVLSEGIQIRTWTSPARVDHVFVCDREEKILYGGYVGWLHAAQLHKALRELNNF
ncbi:putative hydrolase or acyltransferase of alpha/beta superfamily [Xenococcus sp. PCC 7305]|uniref:alpha/beta fold hydrolase n=1 Tax=Xenococcus sp. PCC 7305 TaxID=102125 RepID=UPI0002AC5715|nr:alpha/beta hydrolase [Xenococcus sp. PCC 7305]ELS01059.1 putative hydrolase or acyltransferase of alpha/beta superfamily [Xenococcus sp. PCC 7305]